MNFLTLSLPILLTISSNFLFFLENFRWIACQLNLNRQRNQYKIVLIFDLKESKNECEILTLYQRLLQLDLHFSIRSISLRCYVPHLLSLSLDCVMPQLSCKYHWFGELMIKYAQCLTFSHTQSHCISMNLPNFKCFIHVFSSLNIIVHLRSSIFRFLINFGFDFFTLSVGQ